MATNPIGPNGLPHDPKLAKPGSGPTDSLREQEAARRAERAKATGGSDEASKDAAGAKDAEKLSISRQARELLAMDDLMRNARTKLDETPDVRADRIREVQERLKAGVYDTQGIQDELAHRLTAVLRGMPGDGS